MRLQVFLGIGLLMLAGCNMGPKFAPVSGRVTLNGKPLANATVSFQPMAPEGTMTAGVGSLGTTNANGEFSLKAATGQNGALVGKHIVRITVLSTQPGEGDERPPRGGWPLAEKIPAKYNTASAETFDVPAAGTDKAEFPLSAP